VMRQRQRAAYRDRLIQMLLIHLGVVRARSVQTGGLTICTSAILCA
jgi:hypothetical protein